MEVPLTFADYAPPAPPIAVSPHQLVKSEMKVSPPYDFVNINDPAENYHNFH
jgi:hypothetical protein